MRLTRPLYLTRLIRLFSACPMFVLLACPVFAAQASAPEQILREVQSSLDAKDVKKFNQLVNVQGIVSKAVDILLEDAAHPQTSLPPLLALIFSSAQQSPQASANLRLLLIRETEAFVRYGVQSGHFAGKPDQSVRGGGMLAPLFSDISLGRKELSVSGPASFKDGEAFLPAMLLDKGSGGSYPLLLRMRLDAPSRQITGIDNLQDLWELLKNEARQQH